MNCEVEMVQKQNIMKKIYVCNQILLYRKFQWLDVL